MAGIGGHARPHRGRTDDWITPRWLIDALGPFDLDPCASPTQPWPTAMRMIAPPEDGLAVPWKGRVWLNPPYGPETGKWLSKLAVHGNGIALIFARTETKTFFDHVWEHPRVKAAVFLEGRLFFHRPDGKRGKYNAGGPSVLVAYGERNAGSLSKHFFVTGSGLRGVLLDADTWLVNTTIPRGAGNDG